MSTPAADPIGGLAGMLAHPFMQHALLAGTAIAALSGLVGYFVVLRGQVFAGDMLSHVAYTGSLGALVAGLDARAGLFAATILVALGLGALGGRAAADDVLIGNAMAWMLGLGVFFLALYSTYAAAGNSQANVNVLFGSIFGISATAAVVAALIALALIVALLIIARPLLFASLDPAVAAPPGFPCGCSARCFWPSSPPRPAKPAKPSGRCCWWGSSPRPRRPPPESPPAPGLRWRRPGSWPSPRCGSGSSWPTP